jgi:hypothetical protein
MPWNIVIQPNSNGMTNLRSPVITSYNGCYTGLTHEIIIWASLSGLTTGSDIASINRKCDTNQELYVDTSQILNNYLKENISFTTTNNLIYQINARCLVGGTFVELTGDICYGNLGYSYYAQNGSGTFNQMDVITRTGYIMNCQEVNTDYTLPYEHYDLVLRNKGDFSTVRIKYTKNDGSAGTHNTTVPNSGTTAIDQTWIFSCGYKDIVETKSVSDMNTNKSYQVIFSGKTGTANLTYNFSPEDYCDSELTTLQFMNKYGVWDYFYFTGKKEEELSTKYEEYKHNRTLSNPQLFVTYVPEYGQYHKSFIQGRTKYILNTGWCDAVKNQKLEELFLSEFVIDYNTRLPLILTDKQIRYKTVRYDKLIQYTLTFDSAVDKINSIY